MDANHDGDKIVQKNLIRTEPVKNGNLDSTLQEPATKSVRRWFVVLASFTCNGLIFGLINSVSVIYSELNKNLEENGVPNAATKASLVGSLGIGMTFFLSPVAGILTDSIGIRSTTFLGGCLAIGGLVASSFLTDNVEALYFSFGIVLGVGASLAYTPSLVILGHYFDKYLGVANGFATAGSSIFTLAFPYFLQELIDRFQLKGCFLGLAAVMVLLLVCAFVFRPVLKKPPPPKKRHGHTFKAKLKTIINVEIWKIPKFVIWCIALPVSLFGYFVTFVHVVSYVSDTFNGEYDGKILIQCIAATSLLGRLIFGKVADFKNVNTVTLQQVSFICLGVLTILIVLVNNYYALVAICLGMGIFDGCFVSLMGPVAFKICGQKGASQAIGFLLGLCAIPMTLGPPIAGFIYDQTESYVISFVIAGGMFLIGAAIMFFIRCVKDKKPVDEVTVEPTAVALREDLEANEKAAKVQSWTANESAEMIVRAGDVCVSLILCFLVPFDVSAKSKRDETLKAYNPCCSMPCQHRGICNPISSVYYECNCAKGYYGETCEKSTTARWLLDRLMDEAKKQKLMTTGKLIWGVVNSIPPLHDAALRYLFLSGSDLHSYNSPISLNFHPYATLGTHYNRSYFTRGLPPVPVDCPTPLGIKGPRILPQTDDVFGVLLQRRELIPCPLGTNLMFVTFAQHLVYQFFQGSSLKTEEGGVHASNEGTAKALRSWTGGKLKTRIINGEEYPPYLEDAPEVVMHYPQRSKKRKEVFPKWALGHQMLSKTPLMFAMATIWLREHNRVCDLMAKEHPDWKDERLYRTARRIVLGELLTITAGEYLQHLSQCKLQLEYKPHLFHGEKIPSTTRMENEFRLAFQWDHMLPDVVAIHDKRYNFSDLLYSNNRIVFAHGLDAIVDSMSRHPAGQVTYRNCGKASEKAMKKLIEEGRKTRLHSLNDYRRFYGLKPYESFEELVGNVEMAQKLQKLYGDVDAVEFVVGIFMEKRGKAVVPPTMMHLAGPVALREILSNPIGSPDLWRASTFGGPKGFEIVQKASLRKLFCSNLKGSCRNNVWVSFKTPAEVTALSKKINSVLTSTK